MYQYAVLGVGTGRHAATLYYISAFNSVEPGLTLKYIRAAKWRWAMTAHPQGWGNNKSVASKMPLSKCVTCDTLVFWWDTSQEEGHFNLQRSLEVTFSIITYKPIILLDSLSIQCSANITQEEVVSWIFFFPWHTFMTLRVYLACSLSLLFLGREKTWNEMAGIRQQCLCCEMSLLSEVAASLTWDLLPMHSCPAISAGCFVLVLSGVATEPSLLEFGSHLSLFQVKCG